MAFSNKSEVGGEFLANWMLFANLYLLPKSMVQGPISKCPFDVSLMDLFKVDDHVVNRDLLV
jgi:hypothetical protein